MLELTSQSFSEVYDIINHLEKNLYDRIPQSFIDLIKQNLSNKYVSKIDYNKSINEQEISREARSILAIIYRDFICSNDKKEELQRRDQQELKVQESKIFNNEYVFKNKESKKIVVEQSVEQKNLLVKVKKESILTKIINFIKKLFQ